MVLEIPFDVSAADCVAAHLAATLPFGPSEDAFYAAWAQDWSLEVTHFRSIDPACIVQVEAYMVYKHRGCQHGLCDAICEMSDGTRKVVFMTPAQLLQAFGL
jgi:hypothetical protein